MLMIFETLIQGKFLCAFTRKQNRSLALFSMLVSLPKRPDRTWSKFLLGTVKYFVAGRKKFFFPASNFCPFHFSTWRKKQRRLIKFWEEVSFFFFVNCLWGFFFGFLRNFCHFTHCDFVEEKKTRRILNGFSIFFSSNFNHWLKKKVFRHVFFWVKITLSNFFDENSLIFKRFFILFALFEEYEWIIDGWK